MKYPVNKHMSNNTKGGESDPPFAGNMVVSTFTRLSTLHVQHTR